MFDSSDGIFGHRMVHTKLAAAGVEVSVGTVAAIMAENGWAAKRMRAFKRTTIPSDPATRPTEGLRRPKMLSNSGAFGPGPDDEHGAGGMVEYLRGHGPEQQSGESSVATGTNDQ